MLAEEPEFENAPFHFQSVIVIGGFIVYATAHDNETERLLHWWAPNEFEEVPLSHAG